MFSKIGLITKSLAKVNAPYETRRLAINIKKSIRDYRQLFRKLSMLKGTQVPFELNKQVVTAGRALLDMSNELQDAIGLLASNISEQANSTAHSAEKSVAKNRAVSIEAKEILDHSLEIVNLSNQKTTGFTDQLSTVIVELGASLSRFQMCLKALASQYKRCNLLFSLKTLTVLRRPRCGLEMLSKKPSLYL